MRRPWLLLQQQLQRLICQLKIALYFVILSRLEKTMLSCYRYGFQATTICGGINVLCTRKLKAKSWLLRWLRWYCMRKWMVASIRTTTHTSSKATLIFLVATRQRVYLSCPFHYINADSPSFFIFIAAICKPCGYEVA